MDAAALESVLRRIELPHEGVEHDYSSGAHDTAVMLSRSDDRDDYVVVSATSTGWFEVAVRGRFGTFLVDEDASADEAREILERFVRVAIAYLGGSYEYVRTTLLRVPRIRVALEDETVALNLTIPDAWRTAFRRGPSRSL